MSKDRIRNCVANATCFASPYAVIISGPCYIFHFDFELVLNIIMKMPK